MKKNKNKPFIWQNVYKPFIKNHNYYVVVKALKIFFIMYTIFMIVFRVAIGLSPNFQIYESFYNYWLFFMIILLGSLCILIACIIMISINYIDSRLVILMLSFVFSVVLLNFILSSNGVSLISWTEDLHYALMNNPPSITDELKVVNRYEEYITTGRDGKEEFHKKADLKIGDKTFTVDDVGKIKELLDTHKEGIKVKAVYMPKSNILISLEEE